MTCVLLINRNTPLTLHVRDIQVDTTARRRRRHLRVIIRFALNTQVHRVMYRRSIVWIIRVYIGEYITINKVI